MKLERMEKKFTYYYRAGNLTLDDLEQMRERMDGMFRDFPNADVA